MQCAFACTLGNVFFANVLLLKCAFALHAGCQVLPVRGVNFAGGGGGACAGTTRELHTA